MHKLELLTEEEAKAIYSEELKEIYDVKSFSFGSSKWYTRNGVMTDRKLTLTIDEKGNKEAVEYLKRQGFIVERRAKKDNIFYSIKGTWGNGLGYEIILSLQVQLQEDEKE